MARVFYTDIEIIEKIKKGETESVLQLVYTNHEKETIRWIKKNRGNRQEAQDIFQESILAFYEYVIEGKYDVKYPIGAFLLRVSKNKWINRVKQLQRESLNQTSDGFADEYYSMPATDKKQLIQNVLSQIGETCKELLTYSILYDLTMDDISLRMGFSSTDVAKTKNYKCKKRLENYLNENPLIKEKLTS